MTIPDIKTWIEEKADYFLTEPQKMIVRYALQEAFDKGRESGLEEAASYSIANREKKALDCNCAEGIRKLKNGEKK